MIKFPNAKINLGLNIVSKRPDGYHNLETIFYPIGIKDALEVVPSQTGGDKLHISGIEVDGPTENNLVMKALRLIKRQYMIPDLDIYLHKQIPFGAGLGGGSADAAVMLLLLNELFTLRIPEETLITMASGIGADCAFFIKNKPVFARGIGNEFEETDLSLKGYHCVLVKPDIHVSTPEAYSLVKSAQPEVPLKEVIRRPIEEWQGLLVNDFEVSVFAKYPQIGKIKEQLIHEGAVYASMSGSGSSVFGIFKELPEWLPAFDNCYVWKGAL
ncbi:4-(cytidine 5'-diphospho)-2-C-methyl-D-erythritol kinase [Parabacteroides sp. FAFU027]|uniref:4-(cytidine 5'-diphospho)-2-C-methyl-D-erythritol kinase n=1 Tax=Parabacteroides sp. FAFU027 TaxID=2922715 RepID=UPI001FAEF464|nr:4-(cytidine 5'-diphospho)-2-C-methyl-D-erythritol kinase [Parabacteroides sp. FAFU027]